MNRKFHYYHGKNEYSTISSRGIGSSSGIIRLSAQNSTEKNIYAGIRIESTLNKENSLLNSNSETNSKNNTIKYKFNESNYKNKFSVKNNNNISTLPETKINFKDNIQNNLFKNNQNEEKDINFDFYKEKYFFFYSNKNNNKCSNEKLSDKKNETEELNRSIKMNIKNTLSEKNKLININSEEQNNIIMTNNHFNDKALNSTNLKNELNLNKMNSLDHSYRQNKLYKKSLSFNLTPNCRSNSNLNLNLNENRTTDNNVKKIPILNNSTSNKKEMFYSSISNNQKTKKNRTPRSSAINKTVTSALKQSATYNSQEYLICIIENYAREVGISAYNYRTSEYFITQFIDTENYINTLTMINYWRPIEIVMNQKSENSSLYKIIHKTFSSIYIGFLPRNKFNTDYGKEIYAKSNIRELSLIDLNTKYVCMSSLSGLFNYLENNPDYYLTDSYNIHFHYLENHLNISFNTTLDLELLMNRKNNKTYGSLFSLFSCKTIGGWRLLRSNILQPYTKAEQIIDRQDKIEELKENPDLYSFIKDSLFCFREIEIYITKLLHCNDNHNENDDRYFIIKNKLEAIKGIKDSLCFIPNFVRFLKSYLHSKLNIINEEDENEINTSNNDIYNNSNHSKINIDNKNNGINDENEKKFKFLNEIIIFFSQKEFELMFQKIDELISNETDLDAEKYGDINSQNNENANIYNDKNIINNDISFSNFIAGMKNKKKNSNLYNFKNNEIIGLIKKNDEILFLVRKGENNILDITRKTFIDTLSQVKEEFEELKSEIGDPRMKLFYNEKKRFYISIDKKYYRADDFVVTRKRGNKFFCSNVTLESLGSRITDLKNDIISISYKLLEDLIQYLKNNITLLYSLSGFVANLDIICAFTEYAINNLICSKPIINDISQDMSYIYGKNCCHPLLNKVFSYKPNNGNGSDNYIQDNIIPNDYFFINQFNLLLLKGPNASGKTTYMKQLALLIVLAQIGSFVPCAYFSFNCRKFLYSNFNLNSISKDINNNQEYYNNKNQIKGNFIKQINEIQSVINNKNYTKSLILLDEPFDNTHSQLMMEIIISLLDLFSRNLNSSFVIISSHNDIVNRLSSFYFHSILGSMKVEINQENNDFEFLYKFKYTPQYSFDLHENKKEIENYGINLCKIIGLNKDIIYNSEQISENYKEITFDEVVKSSLEMNVLKSFLIKLYKNMFEIIGEKKNYTIKEQVMISIKNLYNFIENAIN